MLKAVAGLLFAVAAAPACAQHDHHHMMTRHAAAKLETHNDPAADVLTDLQNQKVLRKRVRTVSGARC